MEQEFLHREREASLYEMIHKKDSILSEQDKEEVKKAQQRYDEAQAQLVKAKVSSWERFRARAKGEVQELRKTRTGY